MGKTTKGRSGIARTETIAKIFKLFIQPLIKEFVIPQNATENVLHRKLELYFDKDNRDIWLVRAKSPFIITGPRWYTPDTPERLHVHGDGNRHVVKGDYLYVRSDGKRPDVVDIEFKDQVFATRTTDWSVLSEKVEFVL